MSNGVLPFPLPVGSRISALGVLAPVVAPLLRRALQSEKPQHSLDIPVTLEAGERRIYRAFAHAIDGFRVVLALDDITFQRQLDREVVQAQKNEQLAMLSGTIAHDFSNLLTAVHTFAELGRETLQTDQESTDYFLEQIAQTAMQASQLSRNLLRFSKRESGTPRPVNVATELAKCEPILQALGRGRNEIVVDVTRARWSVFVDPVHLEQVVVNLVGNALDALEGTDGNVIVVVEDLVARDSAGNEGEYVRLIVRDTGSGISPDDIGRIFEPYFSRKEERGTGLGLAICRKIVHQYLGDIRVQSEVGLGTTFEVLLPRHEDAAPTGMLEDDLLQLSGSERVLLVEDQDGLREVLVAFLVRLGYPATGVATAAEAMEIALAEEGHIDVLIADVELAESNGPELAGRMQERWPGVQVLFISGASHPEHISTGNRAAKGSAFLPKPFTARQLAKQIRLLIACARPETT